MKKTILRLLALLLSAALLLCGCSPEGKGGSAANHKENNGITAPSATEQNEPGPAPAPLPALERLGVEMEGLISGLADAGDGWAAAVCTVPDPEDPDWNKDHATIYLIDLYRGRILAQKKLVSDGVQALLGVRTNGEILIRNYGTDRLEFYGPDLSLLRSEEIPAGFNSFDRESDALYNSSNYVIERLSLSDMTVETFFKGLGAVYEEADTARDRLLLECRSVKDAGGWDFALYDYAAERVLVQGHAGYGGVGIGKDLVLASGEESVGDGEDAGRILRRLDVYDPQKGCWDHGWIIPFDTGLYTDPATNYVLANGWLENESGEGLRQMICLIDPVTGGMHDISEELGDHFDVQHTYLRDPDCWLLATVSDESGEDRTSLWVLRPEQVKLDALLEPAQEPDPSAGLHEAGEKLRELRARADGIERTYGVRILLGDECMDMADNGGYDLISLTAETGYSTVEEEIIQAANALDTLEAALETYPEGFFLTFHDFRGMGGLRFCLVADLVTRYGGEFKAAGIQYKSDAWYNIVLDAGSLYSQQTVHHELWHACESRIDDEGLDVFTPDNWSALNPPGFDYTYDFETYYQRQDIYGYLMDESDDPWFVQIYSTVTPMEDRSTLVEKMFSDWYGAEYYGYPDARSWVCSFPHLRSKVQVMHDAVEQVFGVCYWDMP